jgi:hypothetical protein
MARKRGHNGSGSIDQSGENSWRLRYRIDGVRYTKTFEGTRTEAAKELRRLLHSGDTGTHVAPDKMTVGQWIAAWLDLKKRSIKARSHERYGEILTMHVVPVLGEIALQKITAGDIDKLFWPEACGQHRTVSAHGAEGLLQVGREEETPV